MPGEKISSQNAELAIPWESGPPKHYFPHGETVYREIIGADDSEEINLPYEKALVFDKLEYVPSKSFVGTNSANDEYSFNVLGLSLPGTAEDPQSIYHYDQPHKDLAHAVVLKHILQDCRSAEDVLTVFSQENSLWQDAYEKALLSKLASAAKAEFRENGRSKPMDFADQVSDKYERKGSDGNPLSFNSFAVVNGFIAREELDTYNSFDEYRKDFTAEVFAHFCDSIPQKYKGRTKYIPSREIVTKSGKLKRYPAQLRTVTNTDLKLDLQDCFSELREAITLDESDRYAAKHPQKDAESLHIVAILNNRAGNMGRHRHPDDRSPAELIEVARKRIKEFTGATDSEELDAYIAEFEDRCRHHYGVLAPKVIAARTQYTYSGPLRQQMNDMARAKNAEGLAAIDESVTAATRENIYDIKQKIASVFLPEDSVAENVYILPTGIVTKEPGGRLMTYAVTPDDPRLMQCLSDDEKSLWEGAWSGYDTGRLADANKDLLERLNQEISQQWDKRPDSLSPEEQRLLSLLNEHHVTVSPPLDVASGKLNELAVDHIEILEELLPGIGDFIDSARTDLRPRKYSNPVDLAKKHLLSFLSGESSSAPTTFTTYKNGRSLDLSTISYAIESEPDKSAQIMNFAALNVAANVYSQLPRDSLRAFVQLAGDKINISEAEFYHHFGKRVSSASNRRAVACRSFFLTSFSDFLDGKSDEKVTQFFKELKRQLND